MKRFSSRRFSVVCFLLGTWLAAAAGLQAGPAVVLSEFMAINGGTLTDADGDTPDWIEIYNPSATTVVDLAGWHLTDDPADLTRWTFPSVEVPPHGFLIVFASGKNRTDGGELHTNFKLSGDGEYLALVEPDGVTIATEYAPAYPPQRPDVSYGLELGGSRVALVGTGTPCRYLVPADDSLGLSWNGSDPAFADDAWMTGALGLGYERGVGYKEFITTDVESVLYGQNGSIYVRIPFEVDDPSAISDLILQLRYDDGFVAYLNGHEILRVNAPDPVAWDSVASEFHDDLQAVQPEIHMLR